MDNGLENTRIAVNPPRVISGSGKVNASRHWSAKLSLILSLSLMSGCSSESNDDGLAFVPSITKEPNKSPTPVVPPSADEVISTTLIQEDFDSRRQIAEEKISNVTVDVNQGVLYLPAIKLPKEVDINEDLNGVTKLTNYERAVHSGHILIEDDIQIEGSDAVELRAEDSIRVTGHISAGNGGITLIANQAIYIDGTLQSTGPIRLRVTQASGSISVTGKIETLDATEQDSAEINILTRGETNISGVLRTGKSVHANSGAIDIVSYGPIEITRNTSVLETGKSEGGNAGHIYISSEDGLHLMDGSTLQGGEAEAASARNNTSTGGQITIRVAALELGESASMFAGQCTGCTGGGIDIIAEGNMDIDKFARVLAGGGMRGGELSLQVGAAVFGKSSELRGGSGSEQAGRVFIDTPGNLDLRNGTHIVGGQGQCTDGGPVVGLIGGTLTVVSESLINGGDSDEYAQDCISPANGGDVQIFCKSAKGPAEAVVQSGNGARGGTTTIVVNPNYYRDIPIPHPETSGFLESKVFDRGEEGLNMAAVLNSKQEELPAGTRIDLLLSGALHAEGPFSAWETANAQGTWDDDFKHYRYVKYQVALHGRSLDTPILDRFEINLAPAL